MHSDHLGSGRKLTDVNGNVVYRGEFDPHGQTMLEVAPGGSYLNSKKYTGYERNWATNLDDANARTYHHNRARFMQPDPMSVAAADATNPQSLNRYAYVNNDPINSIDPTGLNCRAITYHREGWVDGGYGGYPTYVDHDETVWLCDGNYGGGGGGGTGDGGGTGGGGNSGQTQQQQKKELDVRGFTACVLDAAVNGGISLIPGGSAFLLVAGYLGLNLNVFQSMISENSLVTGPGTIQDASKIAAGAARDIYKTAYDGAGGDVALRRAEDLVSRSSFATKSASSQAKLLGNLKSVSKLSALAKSLPIISTGVTLVAFGLDVKDCYYKYNR